MQLQHAESSGESKEIREVPKDAVFYLADAQRSPMALVDRDAAVVSAFTYHPYGLVKHEQDGGADPHRYVGNEHDTGADLGDFEARPYRADAAIFLAPDVVALFSPEKALSMPARLLAYAYAGGDPINRSDPGGRDLGDFFRGLGDQAVDNVVNMVRAPIESAKAQAEALKGAGIGDYAKVAALTLASAVVAPTTGQLEIVKDVANFGDHFAEAVFATSDYESGRKAFKPVQTAMTVTATVLGARVSAKAPGICPCFAAETVVATPHGPRPIADIRAGDLVLAKDPDTGALAYKPVTRVFVTPGKALVELHLETRDGTDEVIHATPEHPFWVEGRGWTNAGELEVGRGVTTSLGQSAELVAARTLPERQTVYNLEVADFHTYFVGLGEAWVHNTCGCGGGAGTARAGGRAAARA
jgi:RHS repeat-associated protein